jgi:aryl-alcohol dehydrogenase-like predicted oxidoreductase
MRRRAEPPNLVAVSEIARCLSGSYCFSGVLQHKPYEVEPSDRPSAGHSDEDSAALIHAAWDAGIRFFDTAPMYGHGLSEARCGQALRWYPRDEFVISTKVGRMLTPAKRSDIDFTPWASGLP